MRRGRSVWCISKVIRSFRGFCVGNRMMMGSVVVELLPRVDASVHNDSSCINVPKENGEPLKSAFWVGYQYAVLTGARLGNAIQNKSRTKR